MDCEKSREISGLIIEMKYASRGNQYGTGEYQGIDQLRESEAGFPKYRKWIAESIYLSFVKYSNHLSNPKIMEFGAGTGNLAKNISRISSSDVACIEIDSTLIQILTKEEFTTYKDIQSAVTDRGRFDLVYSSNVLEHIEDDLAALIELGDSLVPSTGLLVLYLPAHQWLFSDLDRHVGHFRRYSKSRLNELMSKADLMIVEMCYTDTLGVVATLTIKALGYKSSFKIGGIRSMLLYDRFIHPLSKFLDRIGFKYLIGCNIMLVAKHNK